MRSLPATQLSRAVEPDQEHDAEMIGTAFDEIEQGRRQRLPPDEKPFSEAPRGPESPFGGRRPPQTSAGRAGFAAVQVA